jgi:hypothetical protein
MMPGVAQKPLLDLQTQVWKARGQAKQKWLERSLAEPVTHSREAKRRTEWIKQALDAVKHGQEEVKYQAALLDAYAEHLSVLEMSLLSATEMKNAGDGKHDRRD